MAFPNLHLSQKNPGTFSNHIDHINENIITYKRIFLFEWNSRPLKGIHIIFAMLLERIHPRYTKVLMQQNNEERIINSVQFIHKQWSLMRALYKCSVNLNNINKNHPHPIIDIQKLKNKNNQQNHFPKLIFNNH